MSIMFTELSLVERSILSANARDSLPLQNLMISSFCADGRVRGAI